MPLPQLIPIDGIAGSLIVTHVRILEFEILNETGGLTTLSTMGLYVPAMSCGLFSPQDMFKQYKE